MRSKLNLLLVMTFVCALALSACGAGKPSSELEDTSWKLVSLDGASVLEGTSLTVTFRGNHAFGSSGCNSFDGTYLLRKDKIEIGNTMMTLMACEMGIMDQETIYLAFLQNAATARIVDGQLILARADGRSLVFDPAK